MNPEFYGPKGKEIIAPLIEAITNLNPVIPPIGETLVNSILKNFKAGGRPIAWKKSKRAIKDNGQTLIDTAVMRNSTNWQIEGLTSIRVGLSDEKAKWHNNPSSKSRMPKREFLLIQDEDYDFIEDIMRIHINRELGI